MVAWSPLRGTVVALTACSWVPASHGAGDVIAKPIVNTSSRLAGQTPNGFSFPSLASGAVLASATVGASSSEALVIEATTSALSLQINSSTPLLAEGSGQDTGSRIAVMGDTSIATVVPTTARSTAAGLRTAVSFAATAVDRSSSAAAQYDGVFLAVSEHGASTIATTRDLFQAADAKFTGFASVASAVLDDETTEAASPGATVLAAFEGQAGTWQGILAATMTFSSGSSGGKRTTTKPQLDVVVAVGDAIPNAPHLDFLCVSSPQVSPQGEVIFFGSHCGMSAASPIIARQQARNSHFRTQRYQGHCLTTQWLGLGRAEEVSHVFPGIYRAKQAAHLARGRQAGELLVVADSITAVPGGVAGETFEAFSAAAMGAEGTVAFVGLGTNGTMGIFAQPSGGKLRAVATTVAPGPAGVLFGDFPSVPSVGPDGMVFFYAVSGGGLGGVYAETAVAGADGRSNLEALLNTNDEIEGQGIIYIGFGSSAANAGSATDAKSLAAVYVVLENTTDGIWTLERRSKGVIV
eukprot:TRINITY_DN15541_c0_g2_i1.p1 TRINITY_DN15541_c0_g2~~TRINITY_DN15541_c0_g2_i1.p1  ORF type:complete len:523 (+),score=108.16 TRINITY_DN15541_c0_g2_i1:93-1661(+)